MTKTSKLLQEQDARGANTKDVTVALALQSRVFTSVVGDVAVPTSGTSTVLINPTANARQVSLGFDYGSTQSGVFEFREGVAVSAAGGPALLKNRNRLNPPVPLSIITTNPTVTDEGEPIFIINTAPDSPGGGKRQGLLPVLPLEWALDVSKLYLLRFTNGLTADADVSIVLDLIEPAEGLTA